MRNGFRLAIETSTAIGSVALGRHEEVLEIRSLQEPRNHARGFLPLVAEVCSKQGVTSQDIEMIFVSAGPGSFTGLRIGATAARMLSLTSGCRLVAVPTLAVIAQNALQVKYTAPVKAMAPPSRVVVVLDAKRGHVFTGAFRLEEGRYAAEGEPIEAEPLSYLTDQVKRFGSCAVLGEGVFYHRDALAASGATILPDSAYPPRPEVVYQLGCRLAAEGNFVDRRSFVPIYVRPPEAEEKWTAQRRSSPP